VDVQDISGNLRLIMYIMVCRSWNRSDGQFSPSHEDGEEDGSTPCHTVSTRIS